MVLLIGYRYFLKVPDQKLGFTLSVERWRWKENLLLGASIPGGASVCSISLPNSTIMASSDASLGSKSGSPRSHDASIVLGCNLHPLVLCGPRNVGLRIPLMPPMK